MKTWYFTMESLWNDRRLAEGHILLTNIDKHFVVSSTQRFCPGACQNPERLEKSKPEFGGFETSGDLAIRRPFSSWIFYSQVSYLFDATPFTTRCIILSFSTVKFIFHYNGMGRMTYLLQLAGLFSPCSKMFSGHLNVMHIIKLHHAVPITITLHGRKCIPNHSNSGICWTPSSG